MTATARTISELMCVSKSHEITTSNLSARGVNGDITAITYTAGQTDAINTAIIINTYIILETSILMLQYTFHMLTAC